MISLIFNPFSGAAGDMILGCTLDLGADRKSVKELIEASAPVSVDIKEVVKKGIKALDVRINVPKKEHSRTYPELVDLIKEAKLPSRVEASALDIFLKMAEAEASVHGVDDLEKLHFHEVGRVMPLPMSLALRQLSILLDVILFTALPSTWEAGQ